LPLPALESLSKKYANVHNDISIFSVQHLLSDSVDFFLIMTKHFPQNPFVVGIPYSSKEKAAKEIEALGAKVSVPSFDTIFRFVEQSLSEQLLENAKNGRKTLIIEDGGYATPAIHRHPAMANINHCVGTIEQTKNGLWRDREIRAAEIPIAHVAESMLKDSVEGPAVGRAVARTLEHILGDLGFSIASRRVAVLGYGTIGMNIAKEMKKKEALLMCNDTLILRNIAARFEGMQPKIKGEMLKEADLVIGATGTPSIGIDDILCLKHGAFLASASSKNIEIDLHGLDNLSLSVEKIHEEVDRHRLLNGREILLISKGFPVNFRGKFSIPNDVMDLIFSEMFLCIIDVVNGKYPIGITGISQRREQEVASIWERIYS
jgi:adenosylhomocysteinase